MSKYMRTYADKQAYLNDSTRPTDSSVVSVAGNEVEHDGINVIIPYRSALLETGDEKLYDLYENAPKILKHGTYSKATFDSSRYVRSEAFFLTSYKDRDVFVYKKCIGSKQNSYRGGQPDGSEQWAANNEYKVTLDLTAAGGFSYTCKPYSADISGSCTWAAGATVASVVSQLTVGSGLTVAAVGDTAIKFSMSSYNNGLITFSGVTGATVLDCSFSARIGLNGTERGSHCSFQGQAVLTCFPDLDYMAASTVCYCESGDNSSSRTNVKPDTFKSYWSVNGAAAFAKDSTPMKQSVWESLPDSGVQEQIDYYNKFGGDYDTYLLSRRMKFDYARGINATCREQGLAYTYALANCYFTDAEGNTKHCYPAAALCAELGIETAGVTTGFEAGNWYFCSPTELAQMLTPGIREVLNKGIQGVDGYVALTHLLQYRCQWSVGEYNGNNAWLYNPTNGALINNSKYDSFQVRPLLASERV